ncbi:MAG: hypothetical protein V1706_15400 [Pseudomonadota bacterium]
MQSLSALPEIQENPFARPLEWRKYFSEGDQFLALAGKGIHNLEKFSPETLYNVVAMGIEKHLMALFLYNNNLPEGHTLTNLLSYGEKYLTIDGDILRTLAFMDSLQEICSLDDTHRRTPTLAELEMMVKVAVRIQQKVQESLPH